MYISSCLVFIFSALYITHVVFHNDYHIKPIQYIEHWTPGLLLTFPGGSSEATWSRTTKTVSGILEASTVQCTTFADQGQRDMVTAATATYNVYMYGESLSHQEAG